MICFYDPDPWLNLDRAGDRDPEGIRFAVFLIAGNERGVLRDGKLNVEMYRIDRPPGGGTERTLVSDWHYRTSQLNVITKNTVMGQGYLLLLRWASKSIAGNEVEIVASFEDNAGGSVRAHTHRVRVPKYE